MTDVSYLQRIINRLMFDLFHPARIGAWIETAITIIIILVVARLTLILSVPLLRRWLRPDDPRQSPQRQVQIRTLIPLIETSLRYFVQFIAVVMILDRLHLNVAGLLTSAGVVAVAIGFGAQQIIRNVLYGFLLIFEGVVQVGDVVRIGDVAGTVERVTLGNVQVRRFSGELVTIYAGTIQQVGNMNRGFMRAIVQVGVAYEADLDRAMAVMHQVGETWAAENPDDVMEPPQVHGILEFGSTDVQVRLVVMVKPSAFAKAERELRRRLKAAFDTEGIEIPHPKIVLHHPSAPLSDAKGL